MSGRIFSYFDVFFVMLVPLVPAALLFRLFGDLNFANVIIEKTIHLGGPIGGYAALVLIAKSIHRRALLRHDPAARAKKKLVGQWKMTSQSISGTAAESLTNIEISDEGELFLSGEFKKGGKPMGSWKSISATIDRQQLNYTYILEEVGSHIVWSGRVICSINDKNKKLSGHWKVYGSGEKSGAIEGVRV